MGVVLPQPIQFGKYTLFERIGRGGMADVFKGRVQGPAGFERTFVVKRILPHLCDDETFTKMFIDEAKMSARLSHPNIVQVFELGSVEGEYFISMEYVRGRDLAETMRTLWARIGPPRPELVAYVGREMCRALAYAHDLVGDDGTPLGMIHRDVSPSNVMLSYEGAVKLLDFGIAKALNGEQEEQYGTQRGTLKGKFAYMAPEQTQGSDVDRRIDIFATGIVLHEVLTGRRLFKGENDLQTVEKVRQCDVPPPSLQNPLCPPELDAIVLKALARTRDDRFQTASEMADALDDVVHAARFQPAHLAQLMRDLFPQDAGGSPDGRTTQSGSARLNALTGSSSRPYSQAALRSPTIPPVSRSVSAMRPALPHADLSAAAAPAPRPFWKRGSVWATAGLLGVAFAGGAVWTRSSGTVSTQAAGPAQQVREQELDIALTSMPDGADVFVQGSNEFIGKTPFRRKFKWREDRQTTLVFKAAGYHEETREVKPTFTGFVHLKPVVGGAKPRPRAESRPEEPPAPPPSKPTGEALPPTPAPAVATPGASPPPVQPASATSSGSSSRHGSSGESGSSRRHTSSSSGSGEKKSQKKTDLADPF